MRRVSARFELGIEPRVHRAVQLDDLAAQWQRDLRFAVPAFSDEDKAAVARLRAAGATNVHWIESHEVKSDDVLVPQVGHDRAVVLYRHSDVHHALLTTNRCNSYCVMCSQPPTPQGDAWRVDEAIDVVRHIRQSPRALGLSGGEPLLLGGGLRRLIEAVCAEHPTTRIEVLTNGRLLGDANRAAEILDGLAADVRWLVPLYGHADFLHDFVVQAPGAFDETIAGLLALRLRRQPAQLRVVLIEPVLRVLPDLCSFIGRNLPFVREVALMACEPIGFALANRELCEVDLANWAEALTAATRELRRHGVAFLFMNTPLCALPEPLWPSAHRSISDWKNVYADECQRCSAKDRCAGLFAWHEAGWQPTKIRAIEGVSA